MPNVTVSIDEDLKDLEIMERITSKSELTEEEAEEISEKINRKVADKVL